ncbi:MAG: hypothetical protein RLZZ15_1918 [Verrucomicrobiota bacterium]
MTLREARAKNRAVPTPPPPPDRVKLRLASVRSRAWCLALLALGAALVAPAAEPADKIDATIAEYFRPFQNDLATLSPDGRHVAIAETVRKGAAFITIVSVDDRTSRRFEVGEAADHAVQQILWVSATRLVFTTRSRAIGALELGRDEITVLLRSRDFDAFVPEPQLGPRSRAMGTTPDMPADPSASSPIDFDRLRGISVTEALKRARASGDLFGRETRDDPGRAPRPFLLGRKPGAANTVLIEVRADGDLYGLGRLERREITVPGNVAIYDRAFGPPATAADAGLNPGSPSEYATYRIDESAPPLVVLELDVLKGRTREIARESEWRRVWLDHEGRLRLALERHGRGLRYVYRGADAKKWIPLDSLVTEATSLGFSVTPQTLLTPRSVPLGFDANGAKLFIASNVGRNTFSLRALDLATGRLDESFEVGHPRHDLIEPTALFVDGVVRFDPKSHGLSGVRFTAALRATRWLAPDLLELQAQLAKQLAPRRCEIREWNEDRTRFLLETSTAGDPGGFVVADTVAGKLIQCGERAPGLPAERRHPVHEFDFGADDGRRFAGFLTMPREPRLNPPPVLVYFHDGPWFSDPPEFNRGAQALAALGFAVLQLNHRGSSGFGRAHLTAIDGGLDRVVLEDVRALLARLGGGKLPLNTRLVAALGNGVGGYLAVRMAQLAPETFRCAVAINAPGDLAAWRTQLDPAPTLLSQLHRDFFGTDPARLLAQSALAVAPTTKAPVLVVHAADNAYVPVGMGRALHRALKRGSDETAYLELPHEGHAGWSEATTARLFAELGRFFNATIYNYRVDVRPPEVVR